MIQFEKVYVISLKRRNDRLSDFLNGLPTPWIFNNVELYEGIDGLTLKKPDWWDDNPGSLGCFLSHKTLIEKCILENVNSVLILEDDAVFCDNFNEKCSYFLDHVPNNWEMIYLGGQHLAKPHQEIIDDCVAIGTNINRTHAYALKKEGLIKIKSYLDIEPWPIKQRHIDHYYGYLHKHKHIIPYCPLNMLVGQRKGYSDIINYDLPRDRWWSRK